MVKVRIGKLNYKNMGMIEVTKEKFYEIASKIPYNTSFILGQDGIIRYEGAKKKYKNTLFAKQDNGKYYVLPSLVIK